MLRQAEIQNSLGLARRSAEKILHDGNAPVSSDHAAKALFEVCRTLELLAKDLCSIRERIEG